MRGNRRASTGRGQARDRRLERQTVEPAATAPSEPAPNLGAVVHYVDDRPWENDAAIREAPLLWHGPCAKVVVVQGGRREFGVEP